MRELHPGRLWLVQRCRDDAVWPGHHCALRERLIGAETARTVAVAEADSRRQTQAHTSQKARDTLQAHSQWAASTAVIRKTSSA